MALETTDDERPGMIWPTVNGVNGRDWVLSMLVLLAAQGVVLRTADCLVCDAVHPDDADACDPDQMQARSPTLSETIQTLRGEHDWDEMMAGEDGNPGGDG